MDSVSWLTTMVYLMCLVLTLSVFIIEDTEIAVMERHHFYN